MSNRVFSSHSFADKEICIIADEDAFIRIDTDSAEYGELYRRKDDIEPEDEKSSFVTDGKVVTHHDWASSWPSNLEAWGKTPRPSDGERSGTAVTVQTSGSELSVSAHALGVILTGIFGSLLAVTWLTDEWMIHPLIGILGVIFGATFSGMGWLASKRFIRSVDAS